MATFWIIYFGTCQIAQKTMTSEFLHFVILHLLFEPHEIVYSDMSLSGRWSYVNSVASNGIMHGLICAFRKCNILHRFGILIAPFWIIYLRCAKLHK